MECLFGSFLDSEPMSRWVGFSFGADGSNFDYFSAIKRLGTSAAASDQFSHLQVAILFDGDWMLIDKPLHTFIAVE